MRRQVCWIRPYVLPHPILRTSADLTFLISGSSDVPSDWNVRVRRRHPRRLQEVEGGSIGCPAALPGALIMMRDQCRNVEERLISCSLSSIGYSTMSTRSPPSGRSLARSHERNIQSHPSLPSHFAQYHSQFSISNQSDLQTSLHLGSTVRKDFQMNPHFL